MDTGSGGGTATSLPWSGVTNKPPVFKEEAVSENPSFDNIYKGGVDIYTTSTGITVTCTNTCSSLIECYLRW
jgi:hypothetical protein